MKAELATDVGPLRLKNPVMPASGTYDWFGRDPEQVSADSFGAVVTKSVTLRPQAGNPPIRVAETPSGMLNAIGIPSVGIEEFLEEVLPQYHALDPPVIVSVQAYSPRECESMLARLSEQPRVDAVELNLSCPNLAHGTITAQSARLSAEMVAAARGATRLPIVAKLSPNVTDIAEIARAVEEVGADALCLINTVKGMAVDVETRQALLGNRSGGLSGPAIKPIALSMVWECYQEVDIPIVGVGGIATAEDALQFLLAGARAVQVGTATFREPRSLARIIAGIEEHLAQDGLHSVGELVGWCHKGRLTVGS
ncbi:dihydroorotate dehydrogenase [Rubrobacter marinus]|uniref:Dihydroorotate dehydrogenase n=1 Tax=Rubrobacter marinus TaxID=2653852 RepID=A0A6G8PWC8_9ACTN|nr:dihydroorotate dehydrogenase [Rubrobacter marinus]QIN78493.1 dihydroorotate dehydrogenase [Rubrobacter marinus]